MILALIALLQSAGPAGTDLSHPPRLLNEGSIITIDDYPSHALIGGLSGIVSIAVQVSKQGRMTHCDVTESSTVSSLDRTACTLMQRRGRFEPATDATGAPIEGQFRSASIWLTDFNWPGLIINAPLQVKAIPPGYQSAVKSRLLFDATGRVFDCQVTTSSGSQAADRAACAYARQRFAITPPRSLSSDVPAVGVRTLSATLSAEP